MKNLHTAFVAVVALVGGVAIGRFSIPSRGTNKSIPESGASLPSSSIPSSSAANTESASIITVRRPSPSVPSAPILRYDSSVPKGRTPGELIPNRRIESWRNAGRSTLDDAIQTQLWAIAGGDILSLSDGITLDEHARKVISKMMVNAPAAVRTEYSTPELFAALLLAGTFRDLTGFVALRQRPLSDSETMVSISTSKKGESIPHGEAARFRKATDGTWLRVIDRNAAVELVLSHVLGESPRSLIRVHEPNKAPATVLIKQD